ncbi:MAG: sensor histidine kinase [Clostridia bacterium]|nr:sensor histidine kinase [Clostridia bacterium]
MSSDRNFYYFIIFRNIIMLGTFVLAVLLENAKGQRLLLMAALFSLFLLLMHLREFFWKSFEKYIPYTYIADAALLALLDSSSKYVVNYYFNLYYFFALISAGFLAKKRQRLMVSFMLIAAAIMKYYRFIEAKSVYNLPFTVSYILFTLMVFITISVFYNYSRMLSEEKSRLNSLNEELQAANRLLEEKNARIRELAIFEERNRIARDIHDSVGHNLTGLIMNLDICGKLAAADPKKTAEQLVQTREIARECLAEIRRSVKALKPVSVEQLPLVKSLEELAASSRQKFGIEVRLKVEGEIYKTQPDMNIVIYRAVQESITNSIKHGQASIIDIGANFGKTAFSLLVKDNGNGAGKLVMGSGLSGMVERVRELKGDASFYTNDGFMINITIPAEVARIEQNTYNGG